MENKKNVFVEYILLNDVLSRPFSNIVSRYYYVENKNEGVFVKASL